MTSRSKQPGYRARYAKLHRHGLRLSVPALGYTRRLQALAAIGYTRQQIVEGCGVSRKHVYAISVGDVQHVTKATAQKIDAFYRTASVQPVHMTIAAKKVRTYAIKRGWVPPMAWDDIDDPNDTPKGVQDRCDDCGRRGLKPRTRTRGLCGTCYMRRSRAGEFKEEVA